MELFKVIDKHGKIGYTSHPELQPNVRIVHEVHDPRCRHGNIIGSGRDIPCAECEYERMR